MSAGGPAEFGHGQDVEMESRGRAWTEGCDGARAAPKAGVGQALGGGWARDGKDWGLAEFGVHWAP